MLFVAWRVNRGDQRSGAVRGNGDDAAERPPHFEAGPPPAIARDRHTRDADAEQSGHREQRQPRQPPAFRDRKHVRQERHSTCADKRHECGDAVLPRVRFLFGPAVNGDRALVGPNRQQR